MSAIRQTKSSRNIKLYIAFLLSLDITFVEYLFVLAIGIIKFVYTSDE